MAKTPTGKALDAAIDSIVPIEDRRVLARYYLKAELNRLMDSHAVAVNKATDRSVDRLDDKQLWRLLEALSFTYRANGMFWIITDVSYDWYDLTLPVDSLTLTGITNEGEARKSRTAAPLGAFACLSRRECTQCSRLAGIQKRRVFPRVDEHAETPSARSVTFGPTGNSRTGK